MYKENYLFLHSINDKEKITILKDVMPESDVFYDQKKESERWHAFVLFVPSEFATDFVIIDFNNDLNILTELRLALIWFPLKQGLLCGTTST